ncbi:Pentatricopeptide repeat-containing protein [Acorus calamus]|uniref:Pentatricopeptide repeat-containing protein n=1 Tax=Acorus calamus TaxID=4465 RepID=A0AAV9DRV2_ACOCL|nr:Pentatricopeptide repeat-containing protein [Acorus calamus]
MLRRKHLRLSITNSATYHPSASPLTPSPSLEHPQPQPDPIHSLVKLLRFHLLRCDLSAARSLLLSIHHQNHDPIFNSLIRSSARSGQVHHPIKIFRSMKDLGVSPSVFTYNSLLKILLRRGRTASAKKLFSEMGSISDACTYNILIRGFCLNRKVDEAVRLFVQLDRGGGGRCKPDIITYNTLIDSLCRDGRVEAAHNMLKGMEGSNCFPDVVTYTTVMRGFCQKRRIEDAIEVFDIMVQRGVEPSDVTYNTIIQGLCEAQMLDIAKELLRRCNGFRPNACTFNMLMTANCKMGKVEVALAMFDRMKELEVEPDSASYGLLIPNLCQVGDFETAERLFDELHESRVLVLKTGPVPFVSNYKVMFKYLCMNGKTVKAERVFMQLVERGTLDADAFKMLILGHCKEGEPDRALEILGLMCKRDYAPDEETYGALIEGFLKRDCGSVKAVEVLERMGWSMHRLPTSVFHSVLVALLRDGQAEEASRLIKVMLEKQIRQNIDLSTGTILLLFQNDLKEMAFDTMKSLYRSGYSVKIDELIKSLSEKCKFSEALKILLFSLESHPSVDAVNCRVVMKGLCQIRRTSEAFALFYELTERGKQFVVSNCLKDLRAALNEDGRIKEAEFVSKRMIPV